MICSWYDRNYFTNVILPKSDYLFRDLIRVDSRINDLSTIVYHDLSTNVYTRYEKIGVIGSSHWRLSKKILNLQSKSQATAIALEFLYSARKLAIFSYDKCMPSGRSSIRIVTGA